MSPINIILFCTSDDVEHSENTPKQKSVDEEGVHTESATAVTNSSKIAPVNLEISFAAKQSDVRISFVDISKLVT